MLEERRLLSTAAGASPSEAFQRTPLTFERNVGQADSKYGFVAHGNGYSLLLSPSQALLAFQTPGSSTASQNAAPTMSLVSATVVGADTSTQGIGLDPSQSVSNYLGGPKGAADLTGIANYERVEYGNILPGVDLVYYGNQRQLEYDFDVAPGTSVWTISLHFSGVEGMSLDPSGNLLEFKHYGDPRMMY